MTKIQADDLLKSIVKEKYDRACNNLYCYSLTLSMDRPKAGYEKEYNETLQEVEDIERMIKLLDLEVI